MVEVGDRVLVESEKVGTLTRGGVVRKLFRRTTPSPARVRPTP
jgi:co-chaperonin GroES (HSP10)